MKAELIIYNIKTLYTPYLMPPVKGNLMRDILMIDDAYCAISDGKIIGFGKGGYDEFKTKNTLLYDAKQKIMLPGLIDSHTHLVHGGSRENEYGMLLQGIPYLDILKAGGGIHQTVRDTKKSTCEELYEKAYKSLDVMLTYGVTTVESKSGYGLDLDTEMNQLKVNEKLNKNHEITIVSTYMGAHAIPKRFSENKNGYIDEIIADLQTIKQHDLAQAVDVFCEDSVFSVDDTKKILSAAKQCGFEVKMHADEIKSLGGVKLAIELGCSSVDHLMAITDEDISLLAKSNTVANLLPGTSFYLNKAFAPGRKMVDQGVAVSISTDYNPGSCPTENLQLMMQLVANKMKLTSEEILTAVTINPAYHLRLSEHTGSIQCGKDANVILMDAPNLNYVVYHYGINHTTDVWIKGKHVVKNQEIRRG